MKKYHIIAIVSVICLACLSSLAFADPTRDPFYTGGSSFAAPETNTVYENVDPFSGILTLAHTDLHLPGNGGLDVNLIRTYNSMIWGRRDTSFPGLVAKNERSPLGIGWTMHMGIVHNPAGQGSGYWQSFQPDNPIVEMPDGSKHVFYNDKNDTSRFISKEFWVYKYISAGVYELTLTDGTVYTFEYFTGNAGYRITDDFGAVIDKIGQVTKIRNADNTASINISYYNYNGYSYLKTITIPKTSSETADRTVTFNYDYPAHKLTSITVDNRTLNYGYKTIYGYNYLSSFTPPVGNTWTYDYEPGSNTYELNSITYPTGGRIAYSYSDVSFATGVSSATVKFRVVTGKTTYKRGGPQDGTWIYSYNAPSSGDHTTTITAPGVTETHKFYGWGNTGSNYLWKVGLPMSKEFSGDFSLSESYTWGQGTLVSNDRIGNANWNGTGGWVYDSAIYVPFLTNKIITRDNKTYTTSYDINYYDDYGNPKLISETGDISRIRSVDYWTNASKNIVKGKPHTETVTGTFTGSTTTTWTYDNNSGNVTKVNKDGVVKDYDYDDNGNLKWEKWVKNGLTYYTYYWWKYGLISKKQNPMYTEYRTINVKGYADDEINGRGYKTSYKYDDNLRLTDIIPYNGNPATVSNSTKITYSPDSSTKTVTRGGFSTTYSYDGFGRPTGSSDSKGVTTTTSYNAYGVKDFTDSNIGDKVELDYFGRPTKVTDKDDYYETYNYDTNPKVTVTDKNNKTYTLTYHAFGNPDEKYIVSVTDQDQKTTSYSRNIQGNLTGISQGQGTISRTFSYNDPLHQDRKTFLMSETNPETGTITYGRDEVGNMTSKTDSSGTKYYIYDSLNHLKCISLINNSCTGTTITFDYDNANNRTLLNSPSASITFKYDEVNRQYEKNETMAGRSYTTKYHYNANDLVDVITYPVTQREVTYHYNDNNEVNYVTGFGGSVSSASNPIRYNTAGLPTNFSYSNGISSTIHYNGRNLADSIVAGSVVNLGYGFDSRGNTSPITNHLDSTKNQSFLYDNLSRITTFNGAWGGGSYEYHPDGLGNRKSKTVAGAVTSYSYATKNRLTSSTGAEPASYSYNDNGTLAGGSWQGGSYTLVYDDFDNLTAYKLGVPSLADFAYDGDGMRVAKTANGSKTVYHSDQGGRVLSEDDGNGNFIADYVYLNGKLVAKVAAIPNISIAPTSKNFGDVPVATASVSQITISNTTGADLQIGTITLTEANPTEFAKTADNCSGRILVAGNPCTIDIAFTPTAIGAKSATLNIPSDDPDTPNVPVSLNGNGIYPLLTVTKSGTGSGTVTSLPPGIDCGGVCSSTFLTGTAVTLQATAAPDSSFGGWKSVCSGTGPCGITMSGNTTIEAIFSLLPPVADFSASPTTGNMPLSVSFTDLSQRANIWEWTLGDGTTDNLQNPSHTYTEPGTYSVSLKVTNVVSGSNTITKDNLIYVAPLVQIPRVPLAYFPTLQAACDAVQDGEVVQSQALTFTESLNINLSGSVTLNGGYSPDYAANTGLTVITGTLTVTNGVVIVNNVSLLGDPATPPLAPLQQQFVGFDYY
ncbi:MAG: choice-of-anchor D domain-containing protein [Geobacteraceae bacterium]|nr:choice-of-anchor D domain-containing protein [Geobacteraceae bacterium]